MFSSTRGYMDIALGNATLFLEGKAVQIAQILLVSHVLASRIRRQRAFSPACPPLPCCAGALLQLCSRLSMKAERKY